MLRACACSMANEAFISRFLRCSDVSVDAWLKAVLRELLLPALLMLSPESRDAFERGDASVVSKSDEFPRVSGAAGFLALSEGMSTMDSVVKSEASSSSSWS